MPGYDWRDDTGTVVEEKSGYTPSYSSGNGGSTDGNGNNQDDQNNQTGETGSSGHKLLDQYNKLVAEGKGGTTQAQELGRYLGKVEQKYQSEGESLFGPVNPNEATMIAGQNPFTNLTEWEKIWKLASTEAGDPFDPENRYSKSFEGSEWIKSMEESLSKTKSKTTGKLLTKDDPEWDQALRSEWTYKFGMPSITMTQERPSGEPIKTTPEYDDKGNLIFGDKYIYTGLGKSMMDQVQQDNFGLSGYQPFDYGTSKDQYWSDRTEAERAADLRQPTSWGGDGGGGGGTGYYGDPRKGNPIEQMANFYTPQADLQQAMVNVHGTPTGFRGPGTSGFQMKRGGIVSLLRLS